MLIQTCIDLDAEIKLRKGGKETILKEKRKDLKKFLESRSNFNAARLLEMISPTDFYEEEIVLLMKDNRSGDALKIFINNE